LVRVRYVSLLEKKKKLYVRKKTCFKKYEFDINLLSDEDDYVRMIHLEI